MLGMILSFSFKGSTTRSRSSSSPARVTTPYLSSAALQDESYQPSRAYHSIHEDRCNFASTWSRSCAEQSGGWVELSRMPMRRSRKPMRPSGWPTTCRGPACNTQGTARVYVHLSSSSQDHHYHLQRRACLIGRVGC
jgi:hypothetical protein